VNLSVSMYVKGKQKRNMCRPDHKKNRFNIGEICLDITLIKNTFVAVYQVGSTSTARMLSQTTTQVFHLILYALVCSLLYVRYLRVIWPPKEKVHISNEVMHLENTCFNEKHTTV
jgi:hypothetical protein